MAAGRKLVFTCPHCGGRQSFDAVKEVDLHEEPEFRDRIMSGMIFVRRCPDCGKTVYPRIDPAVIVGITNGDKILLTKYRGRANNPRYALVAGYCETGETAEDTVRREVFEEVGLRVKNIRYYKSQPWPFSSSLLLGYTCELDGDDTITLEEDELSLAEWVEREDLPDRSRDISLTSEIMETFRTGKW